MNYSVVICSYNKLEYLKLVTSALQAIGGDHQYILADDCSNDGTVEWANSINFFDKVYSEPEDNGYCLCTIRNRGIERADFDHVVLLDADCMPEETYFNGHNSVFADNKEALSAGFTHFYDSVGKKIINPDHRRKWVPHGKSCVPMGWMSTYGGNMAFTKSVWKTVGGFDERYNGAWGLEDADFAYSCHKKGFGIFAHVESVVRHLKHPVSGTKEMRFGRGPNTKKFKDKHGFSPC